MAVRIVCGANERRSSVAGRSVGYVACALRDAMNIGDTAEAWVNGQVVPPDYALLDGDTLEFVVPFGLKGGLPDHWSLNELKELVGDKHFARLKEAGFVVNGPVSKETIIAWNQWLLDTYNTPQKYVPVSVDVEGECVTFRGKTFHCDRPLLLILKCLVDARGEIRSTGDIRTAFPDEPWEERLDLTIKRRLQTHPSGVGRLIESVDKRGYRLRLPIRE